MTDPFFSILIPTKDRSLTFESTLISVLKQDFKNYEIVVLDNSSDDSTLLVIKKYQNENMRYIRTGNLSMVENWSRGYHECAGKYIVLISDRLEFLYDKTLSKFQEILKHHPEEVITYKWNSNPQFLERENSFEYTVRSSEEILSDFFAGGARRNKFNVNSPKGLNTVLPVSVYKNAMLKFGSLCENLAPDFTMAFKLLNLQSKIVCINSPVLFSPNEEISNGLQSKKDKSKFRSYLQSINYSDEDSYRFTPIAVSGVYNCMYNDLFSLSAKYGWGYRWNLINRVEYFCLIFSEIDNNEFVEEKDSDLNIWYAALMQQPIEISDEVLKLIELPKGFKRKKGSIFQRIMNRLK